MGRVDQIPPPSHGKQADALAKVSDVEQPSRLEYAPTSVPPEELAASHDRSATSLQWTEKIYIGVMVVAILTIALTLGLVFGLREDGETVVYVPATRPPTPSPTKTNPLLKLEQSLPESTVQQLSGSSSSPQRKAFDWLLDQQDKARFPPQHLPTWRQKQLFALATLYYSFYAGPHGFGRDWLDYSIEECRWATTFPADEEGGVCNGFGEFQALDLREAFISPSTGRLPDEISLLSQLKIIRLDGNDIWEKLDLGFVAPLMNISDTFEELSLRGNRIRGWIPPTHIGKFTKLRVLRLESNRLSHSLPSELGLLTKLEHLTLQDNAFTGTLPSELGLLTSLRVLDVSFNAGLNGSIPATVKMLMTNYQLEVLGTNGTNIASS